MTRYELAPLAHELGVTLDGPGWRHPDDADTLTGRQQLAELCGVSERTISNWAANGIPSATADRLACKVVGVNPANIWPDWQHDAA